MGIFAGQVPAGPYYTAAQRDVSPNFPGQAPVTTPQYVSSTVPAVGDAVGQTPAGPYYSATSLESQQEAFGQVSVNKPPYVSTVADSPVVGTPGLSGTDNPLRHTAINGLPPVNTGNFEQLPTAPFYTAQNPNS